MALARRRHSPGEDKLYDDRTETWLSQAERDAVTIAFAEDGLGWTISEHSSMLPAGQRESFVLGQIACTNRGAAIGRWAEERRIPLHLALRRFERPEQSGDWVATRAEL
jgi:hypothetical protein